MSKWEQNELPTLIKEIYGPLMWYQRSIEWEDIKLCKGVGGPGRQDHDWTIKPSLEPRMSHTSRINLSCLLFHETSIYKRRWKFRLDDRPSSHGPRRRYKSTQQNTNCGPATRIRYRARVGPSVCMFRFKITRGSAQLGGKWLLTHS